MVCKLQLCLYETRDAALTWEETLSQHMIDNGFVRGASFPSVLVFKERAIWTLVHGDDSTTAGGADERLWFRKRLEEAYEIKTKRIGPNGETTGKVFN